MCPGPESLREDQLNASHRYGSFKGHTSHRERFASQDGAPSQTNNNIHRVHNSDSKDKEQQAAASLVNEVNVTVFRKFESEATVKGDHLDQSFDRHCATAQSHELMNMNPEAMSEDGGLTESH
jgi:hypothetical protein